MRISCIRFRLFPLMICRSFVAGCERRLHVLFESFHPSVHWWELNISQIVGLTATLTVSVIKIYSSSTINEYQSFLWDHWYPFFGLLVMFVPWVSISKAECVLRIYSSDLTWWPLGSQYGCRATLVHLLFQALVGVEHMPCSSANSSSFRLVSFCLVATLHMCAMLICNDTRNENERRETLAENFYCNLDQIISFYGNFAQNFLTPVRKNRCCKMAKRPVKIYTPT